MQRFGKENLRKAVAQAGLACVCLLASWGVLAASFGTPILESALGERLRVVLPLTGTANDRLGLDCVKLRESATEAGDITRLVRAELIERRSGQAILLTTSQPVNDLIVSFEVGIGCGSWFSRRYTFLLDLPRERPQAAADAPVTPPVATPAPAVVPPEARPVQKPGRRSARKESPLNGVAPAKVGVPPPSIMRPLRPEDEPGVLPKARTGGRAVVAKPQGTPAARSLLKIEMGGIDQLLAGVARSPIEEATGMRLTAELGAATAGRSSQAGTADFKLAHARFLAAMRDQPDPLTTDNAALGKRLDGLAKDLSSLKVDLQKSAARTKELESSHVAWWWLIVAALLAAGAGVGITWFARRSVPERLILVDPVPKARTPQSPVEAVQPEPQSAPKVDDGWRSSPLQPDMEADATPTPAAAKPLEYEATIRVAPRRSAEADPQPPSSVSDRMEPDEGKGALPSTPVPASAPGPAPAPFVLDKNSLTQQLAAMTDLADESWASYRHSSDTSGVALPFASANTDAPATPPAADAPLNIQFDLSEDIAAHAEQKADKDAPDLAFDPASATDLPKSNKTGAPVELDAFALETLDLPTFLAEASEAVPAAFGFEAAIPSTGQAAVMHSVMAAASSIMETAWRQREIAGNAQAVKTIATYVQSAPSKAPPGPWIMLAHLLHDVGMKREYVALQALFLERFGGNLPSWEEAYELRKEQLGLARAPGIEILVANKRGQPDLIGSLAGVAYRTDVPPAVLFDLTFQLEVLQLAADCPPGFTQTESDVDLSL